MWIGICIRIPMHSPDIRDDHSVCIYLVTLIFIIVASVVRKCAGCSWHPTMRPTFSYLSSIVNPKLTGIVLSLLLNNREVDPCEQKLEWLPHLNQEGYLFPLEPSSTCGDKAPWLPRTTSSCLLLYQYPLRKRSLQLFKDNIINTAYLQRQLNK